MVKITGICTVSSGNFPVLKSGVLAGAGSDCVADEDRADDSLRAAYRRLVGGVPREWCGVSN